MLCIIGTSRSIVEHVSVDEHRLQQDVCCESANSVSETVSHCSRRAQEARAQHVALSFQKESSW
jgi:hypothetical protein